jgi:ABC-type multidrug transport system fused ATPase/permease subunit
MCGLVLLMLTSTKLTLLVLLIVPATVVPIVVLGRKLRASSRDNQDLIAQSSGLDQCRGVGMPATSYNDVPAFFEQLNQRRNLFRRIGQIGIGEND